MAKTAGDVIADIIDAFQKHDFEPGEGTRQSQERK
jgi:hypothetical protein